MLHSLIWIRSCNKRELKHTICVEIWKHSSFQWWNKNGVNEEGNEMKVGERKWRVEKIDITKKLDDALTYCKAVVKYNIC